MARAGRPVSAGFTGSQAATFSRIFREESRALKASNPEIGQAIDGHQLAGDADGLTLVQNALSPSRKLTHRVARIIVAGLFLADGPRKLAELRRQQAALTRLGGAMYAFKAWDAQPGIPALIPPEAIENLAAMLAAGRPALKKRLIQRLRDAAPSMSRAWCEHLRRTPLKSTSPRILDCVDIIERLVQTQYPAAAGRSHGTFSLGSEFALLHRERPDLTEDFLGELNRAHAIDARR